MIEEQTGRNNEPDRRKVLVFFVLILLLIAAVGVSLSYGRSPLTALRSLFSDDSFGIIVRKVRLPRTIIAFLVGGALGVCGVALQSLLRNPLAEPYTLGVSGGASLGVAISTLFGLQRFLGFAANPIAGFAGALTAVAAVYILAQRRFFQPAATILFGIVVSLVFSSCIFFVFSLMDPDRMQVVLMWLMGDLSSLDIEWVPYYIPILLIPSFIFFLYGKDLDVLSLGHEKAGYLGVDPEKTYRKLFVLTSILTGTCVSAAGIIGFVGLIVPHMLRQLIGATHTTLLVASYLCGAFFLVASDVFSRYLLYPVELPVGVVTGMLGGIILLTLLARKR